MYYTITTITTVGYGDITGTNSIERSISAFLEVFGVCFFAVVSGKILNIIGNFESRDQDFRDKKELVDKMSEKFNFNR